METKARFSREGGRACEEDEGHVEIEKREEVTNAILRGSKKSGIKMNRVIFTFISNLKFH